MFMRHWWQHAWDTNDINGKNSHKNHVISTINSVEDAEGTIEIV